MKIQKLVAFGIAGAALFLGGSSSAGTENLWSLQPVASKVATNNSIDVKINGTGKCGLWNKLINPDGTVAYDKQVGQSIEPASFPTTAVVIPKQAGVSKLVVYTVAHPQAQNCPAGQEISINITAFAEPVCPKGWQRTYFDKNTGAISCAVQKPQLTCASKTEPFYSATWPAQCAAGCQGIIY